MQIVLHENHIISILQATERQDHEKGKQQGHQKKGCATGHGAPKNACKDHHQDRKGNSKAASTLTLLAENSGVALGIDVVVGQGKFVIQHFSIPDQKHISACDHKRGTLSSWFVRQICQTFLDSMNLFIVQIDHQTQCLE
jgi:hypothetical protein